MREAAVQVLELQRSALEANRLLGVDLDEAALEDRATRELVTRLASDRENPRESLIQDLAEILFLPREQRSEHVTNTQAAPPYRIGKLMLEYAVKARRIDEILTMLTKGYCAAQCDRLPIGCCTVEGFDMGLVPQAMLELQEIEAQRDRWPGPTASDACKFHTATGCVLRLFKSPACAGMLCDPLLEWLRGRYPQPRIEPFLERLTVFRNCDIDRVRVFEAMDSVIGTGELL
jgi:hypothetical protein